MSAHCRRWNGLEWVIVPEASSGNPIPPQLPASVPQPAANLVMAPGNWRFGAPAVNRAFACGPPGLYQFSQQYPPDSSPTQFRLVSPLYGQPGFDLTALLVGLCEMTRVGDFDRNMTMAQVFERAYSRPVVVQCEWTTRFWAEILRQRGVTNARMIRMLMHGSIVPPNAISGETYESIGDTGHVELDVDVAGNGQWELFDPLSRTRYGVSAADLWTTITNTGLVPTPTKIAEVKVSVLNSTAIWYGYDNAHIYGCPEAMLDWIARVYGGFLGIQKLTESICYGYAPPGKQYQGTWPGANYVDLGNEAAFRTKWYP